MHFNVLTIFPEMFPGTLGGGVVGRALDNGIWSCDVINIRDFATDDYGSVDDAQFGGGAGQVMRADILASALDTIANASGSQSANKKFGPVIYFSPRGRVWNQKLAREFVKDCALNFAECTLLCGRYEGIDQRVIEEYDMMEISIGDYILSGGEIAAQVFIDSCVRLLDNVVHGGEDATANESFEIGGLEWPLYTRPSVWRGRKVPEVLLSGHHGNIERWRKSQSDAITKERRPDLIKID
ncbi:MAG: tRNA (guanosine(37)-N1)-methyltransferase TrmD [Rickettsiales bacterium]|jgi:tRNA (guanine37-N1)-methyltransferase|nr:tRNA (guanosine(37)-N1)-methyltransferase TrmD [Rickettsiales bacterium]